MFEEARTIEEVLTTFLAIENPTEEQLIAAFVAEELLRPEPTEDQLWEVLCADTGGPDQEIGQGVAYQT